MSRKDKDLPWGLRPAPTWIFVVLGIGWTVAAIGLIAVIIAKINQCFTEGCPL